MIHSILNKLCAALVIAAASAGFSGCSGQTDQHPQAGQHASHDHDHGDHDHGDHDHAEVGPHNGDVVELGKEEYHAELVHDDASHRVTVYLLDAHAKKSVSIPAEKGAVTLNLLIGGKPAQYQLVPVAEASGRSSQFEIVDDTVCAVFCSEGDAKARLNVTIQGKSFVGMVDHHAHDGHDHATGHNHSDLHKTR
jgi:hypothetical protein